MNVIKKIAISSSMFASAATIFAASFHSTGKTSVVAPGTYDELYADGRKNLGVILDEYGMTSGIGDGVVIDYSGSDSLSEVNGIRIYKKSTTISGVGDIYADISMNFTSSSAAVSGLFLRSASQAEGKSVFVDKISVYSGGGASTTSMGINNWTSSIGNISGLSESSEIRAESEGNHSYGIWNQTGGTIGNISQLSIVSSGAKSTVAAIMNDGSGSRIGNLDGVKISASGADTSSVYGISAFYSTMGDLKNVSMNVSGSKTVYGIDLSYAEIGSISDSSIEVSGGTDTIGIFSDEGVFGTLSNVKISASGNGYAAGICLAYYNPATVIRLENSSVISAESASGKAYSISNESANRLTISGDSTVHTLKGVIYSKGELALDGNFKLEEASIALGSSMTLSGSLSWSGSLSISGGDVVFADGSILNILLGDLSGLDEYMVLETDSTITATLANMDLTVSDSSGAELSGWAWELRHGEGGDQIWITSTVPEASSCAAVFGCLALFAALFYRKSRRA